LQVDRRELRPLEPCERHVVIETHRTSYRTYRLRLLTTAGPHGLRRDGHRLLDLRKPRGRFLAQSRLNYTASNDASHEEPTVRDLIAGLAVVVSHVCEIPIWHTAVTGCWLYGAAGDDSRGGGCEKGFSHRPRAEVRFDNLTGCLRSPGGGSGRFVVPFRDTREGQPALHSRMRVASPPCGRRRAQISDDSSSTSATGGPTLRQMAGDRRHDRRRGAGVTTGGGTNGRQVLTSDVNGLPRKTT
jgi:hypothetical protein